MIKRSAAFLLALILVLSALIACNSGEGVTQNSSTEPNEPTASSVPAQTDPEAPSETDAPEEPEAPVILKRQLLKSATEIGFTSMRVAATKNNPVSFKQNVNDILEGKTVTKIGVPVIKISDPAKDASTELHLIKVGTPAKIIETYPLTILANT